MPTRLVTFYRALGRFDKFSLLALIFYVALRLAAPASLAALLLLLVVIVAAGVQLARLIRFLIRRSIWRLRNRLIVAYLFIAVVPICLIAVLTLLAGWMVIGQVAVYLVSSELERRHAELRFPIRGLFDPRQENREEALKRAAFFTTRRFPALEIVVSDKGKLLRYPETSSLLPPPAGWKDTSGVVVKDGRLYSWAHSSRNGAEATLIAPLSRDYLAELVPNLGEVSLGVGKTSERRTARMALPAGRENRKDYVPAPANRFDLEFAWPTSLTASVWEEPGSTIEGVLIIRSRVSAVLRAIFGNGVDMGDNFFFFFVSLSVLFLIVELIALFIGVSLTRTITSAVHELYEGTLRVKEADFSHRIPVRGGDQLAELSTSFNIMTENLGRLIVVAKEKERMQSELEIAREVQNQLFPKSIPELNTLELAGACDPARMVSGDYYDFQSLDEHSVALAIGDVAGKGISAALLMAAIQSIMRTQLSSGMAIAAAAGNGHSHPVFSTSQLVSVLNKQLYANTAPEKYATFYLGLYDEPSATLTYTNAGHLSPFLVRGANIERLEPTGTVVGAFPFSRYREQRVAMQKGDLLVAFTDGIVEPENEYGEMFGEDRLGDMLIKLNGRESGEIIAEVMEAVRRWTGTPELQDDMTLLLVRRI
jgi:phosphoserine phosphatase RsbU/P